MIDYTKAYKAWDKERIEPLNEFGQIHFLENYPKAEEIFRAAYELGYDQCWKDERE